MTVGKVRKEIAAAKGDNKVTVAEARKIVNAAKDGKVTAGEARLIVDLFEGAEQPPAGSPRMTSAAKKLFDQFFLDFGLPEGRGLSAVQAKISAALSCVKLGAPLARAPKTAGLFEVPIDAGRTAHLDPAKGTFLLEERANGAVRWYGPLALGAAGAADRYAEVARRVLAEYGLEKVSVCISESEAQRQSALGAVGFEQALRSSIESFLRDGAEIGSLPYILRETSEVPGGPADLDAAVRDWVNRPTTTLGLLSPAPTDAEKAKGIFPPENGEPLDQNWVFSLFVPDLSGTLHWAVTDRTGEKPTYNYGFD